MVTRLNDDIERDLWINRTSHPRNLILNFPSTFPYEHSIFEDIKDAWNFFTYYIDI